MASPLSSWRFCAFAGLLALLSLGMACHKKNTEVSSAGNITISGTLTYTRLPLVTDPTTGMPTGLESDSTKFTKLPARGVIVRVYQQIDTTNFDGNIYNAWVSRCIGTLSDSSQGIVLGTTITGTDGKYSFTVPSGYKTYVEVISDAKYISSAGDLLGEIHLFAEPAGIKDPTLEPDRLFYALRKGMDGSLQTDALALPGTMADSNATINFDVGLTDPWWVTPKKDVWTDELLKTLNDAGRIQFEGPQYLKNPNNLGTGSRVLAILDSGYSFSQVFGSPSPNGLVALDLNYFYDCSSPQTQPQFSNMDYDLASYSKRLPQAFDGNTYHFFGSIQGGSQSDDAFDEGVLFPIFAKNKVKFDGSIPIIPIQSHRPGDQLYLQDLQDLRPDLALLEGLGQAMAAYLLKSPYLADTTGQIGGGLNPINPVRDIRDLTGLKKNAFSAPNISSLSWEVILKSNGLSSPGTLTDWAKIDNTLLYAFFTILPGYDIHSIFSQLGRLQETTTQAAIFTDPVLTAMLAPFNIPWPRPTIITAPNSPYLTFIPFWEQDPNSLVKPLPALTLSMAYAHEQDSPGPDPKFPFPKFPNVSWGVDDPMHPTLAKGEIFTGMFSVSRDTIYDLSLNTSPAIPASATVTVFLATANSDGSPAFGSGQIYSFGASSTTQHYQVTIGMGTVSTASVAYIPVMVRLVSPDVQQPSDLTVTVNLVPLR